MTTPSEYSANLCKVTLLTKTTPLSVGLNVKVTYLTLQRKQFIEEVHARRCVFQQLTDIWILLSLVLRKFMCLFILYSINSSYLSYFI